MNEAQTRHDKIDPKLSEAGWGIVPGSKVLVEQSAYIAPGRITTTGNRNPKKADYILEYKGQKLAVIEAKSDELDVSELQGACCPQPVFHHLPDHDDHSQCPEGRGAGYHIGRELGREELLRTLDEAGFAEEKLNLLKNVLKMQKCDLLDVLEYIAYNSTPIERARRVELVKKQYVDSLNREQREFDELILQYYISNGFRELSADNLKTFISIRFNSMSDAKQRLQMSPAEIRSHYFELQRRLYQ